MLEANQRWRGLSPFFMAFLGLPCLMSSCNNVLAFIPTSSTHLMLPTTVTRQRICYRSRPSLEMSAEQATTASLHVSLDQPLIIDQVGPVASSPPKAPMKVPDINIDWKPIKKSLIALLKSEVFRTAVVVFSLFFAASLIAKSINNSRSEGDDSNKNIASSIKALFGSIKSFFAARIGKLRDGFKAEPVEEGVLMPFDYSNDNDGWGVCSLRSKRRLGKSSFVQYEFDLPEPDYVLPLDLGQQISLCCLDDNNNVAKGDFFPYSAESSPSLGTFSILAPNRTPKENEFAIGDDAANFVRVLKQDLKVGDEVALRPGENFLEYRGQYLPVTDMLYIACGTGIVPVMDQVRAVLPSDSSSVESVTVVWTNESTRDFDVTADQLEKEYNKYSNKLAVSCIVDDLTKSDSALEDNVEIYEAVPDFKPGTMAVLCGPATIMEKAAYYLEERGYPSDCICIL